MTVGLLGKKIGMTTVIGDKGEVEPVTVIKAGPCVVLQVKDVARDGYDAIQLGFEDVKPHRSTKPLIGHAGKAGTGPKRTSGEIRLAAPATAELGDVLTVETFANAGVQYVDVTGETKGRGFAGVMKRHNFGGKEASHGVERKHRSPGSVGGHANLGLGRGVKKGKRMAGHMGCANRTMMALRVVSVDTDNDLLLIRGSIPGANGSVVTIRTTKKVGRNSAK